MSSVFPSRLTIITLTDPLPAQQASLPSLTDSQTHKLRLLTLVTLVSTSTPKATDSLSYSTLQSRLGLTSTQAIEQLVTDAIYADLLVATLDPAHQTVRVSSVAPIRDIAPGSVAGMLAELSRWSTSCDTVLAGLSADMDNVRARARERARRDLRRHREVDAAAGVAEDMAKGVGTSGEVGQSGGFDSLDADAMDIDGQDVEAAGAAAGGSVRAGSSRR